MSNHIRTATKSNGCVSRRLTKIVKDPNELSVAKNYPFSMMFLFKFATRNFVRGNFLIYLSVFTLSSHAFGPQFDLYKRL